MGEKDYVLGIGELAVSARPEAVLKTFGLGSCVALVLFDTDNRVGGMVHVALPDSTLHDPQRVQAVSPGYYADTAIEALVQHMGRLRGGNRKGLHACLVGGASVLPNSRRFFIGKRNVEALRHGLDRRSIPIRSEDTGGAISRTVFLDVATGCVTVFSPGRSSRTIVL